MEMEDLSLVYFFLGLEKKEVKIERNLKKKKKKKIRSIFVSLGVVLMFDLKKTSYFIFVCICLLIGLYFNHERKECVIGVLKILYKP